MKLINSKVYKTTEAVEEGQCMMCGKELEFYDDVEATKHAFCCGFDYELLPDDPEDVSTVKVKVGIRHEKV